MPELLCKKKNFEIAPEKRTQSVNRFFMKVIVYFILKISLGIFCEGF